MAAPTATGPGGGFSVEEDVSTVIPGVSVDDADGDLLRVLLRVEHGTLSVIADAGFVVSNGGRDLFLFPNPPDTLNGILAGLTYQPDGDFSGTESLSILVTDNGTTTTSNHSFTVTPVNDLPTVQGPATYNGNEDTAIPLGGITVDDVDGDPLTAIVNVNVGTLSIDPQFASLGTVTDGGRSILFTSKAAADINAALATLTYHPDSHFAGPAHLAIIVRDPSDNGNVQQSTIAVQHVNDPPEIVSNGGGESESLHLVEGETFVTKVIALDTDGDTINYKISGGADASLFRIDPKSGNLSFASAPSYGNPRDSNGDNLYRVTVKASDGEESDEQKLAIEVVKPQSGKSQNKAPEIVSDGGGDAAAITVSESTNYVTQVFATDQNAGTRLTYSISGGADKDKFNIDPQTGSLFFDPPVDFESPGDTGQDNVYNVVVKVSDGKLKDSQAIAVTVTDAEEAPIITSDGGDTSAFLFHRDGVAAVTTVVATDSDAGDVVTYSILGGPDASLFTIDPNTGALSFVVAPDHAAPSDADGNNLYQVVVGASDGLEFDFQMLSIAVGDAEGVVIAGTRKHDKVNANKTVEGQPLPTEHGDIISGRKKGDELSGLGGDDILNGGRGGDKLKGGVGNDILIGGRGKNILKGGEGNDAFFFSIQPQGGGKFSKIKDFETGTDLIAFDHDSFLGLPTGFVSDDLFRIGKKAKDDDDRLLYSAKNGKLKYDEDGVGGEKAALVAKLDKNLDLQASDLLVV